MALVSQTIASFKGGVSQQPDIIRFPDQVSELINGFPNEVEGLQKRPPTLHIKRLGESIDPAKVKHHVINRDDKEQYILQLESGNFKVWDLQGNQRTCKFEDDSCKQYITTSDPRNKLKAITVADYTFVVNTEKVVDEVSGTSPDGLALTSMVYIKNAQYAKAYAIYIDNQFICGVFTPDGGSSSQATQTTTAYIAKGLYELMTGSKAGSVDNYDALLNRTSASNMVYAKSSVDLSNYTIALIGDSTITITAKSGTKRPVVSVKDGFGNQNALSYMGEVTAVNKLPPVAPDGYIMKVAGEKNSEDDDYYVKWNNSKNVWKETVAPKIPYKITATNMPHAITRNSDGSFTLKKLSWVNRGAGDEDTNPDPSFIGRNINDIFFYRNRLGVISDESIVLSATNDFYNFWYKSAATITDTDPIDVSVSSNKVAILTNVVPFARELLLFSREGQFVLSSDGVLTPKSVKCDQITSFDYNDLIQPLGIGPCVYFVNDRVNFSSLMRYFSLDDVADLKDAEDVSSHIPMYIPKGVNRLSGNSTENTITIVNGTDTVYCYKFILTNGTSAQQAWFKWKFSYNVCLAEFIGSTIYFLLNHPTDGLFLEKAQLTGNALDFSEEPSVRLFMDRKVFYEIPENATYSDYYGRTTLSFKSIYDNTVPSEREGKYYLVTTEGYVQEITQWDSETGQFVLEGDYRGTKVFVGRAYDFDVDMSKLSIKKQTDAGGTISEDEGRLQLRYAWLNYNKSGVFDCSVTNAIKDKKFKYTFTGKTLGEAPTKLGVNKVYTGKFKFPVQDNNNEVNIKIHSDNVQPLNIVSGGWEGLYIRRNSGV